MNVYGNNNDANINQAQNAQSGIDGCDNGDGANSAGGKILVVALSLLHLVAIMR